MECARAISGQAAAELIPAGATLALASSGGGLLEPDAVLDAIEQHFHATGQPSGLTVVHGLGIGDGRTRGLNALAHEGLVARVIGGHWSWSPTMQQLGAQDRIAAYVLPGGVISRLLREIGAGRPGLVTTVGLGTFVDPRQTGGRANAAAQDTLVELLELDGRPYLRYKPFPVDVAVVRGWAADPDGNVTLDNEPALLDTLAAAQAAKASGGTVIAQVKEVRGWIHPQLVHLPRTLVDHVVVHPGQAQTYESVFEPAYAGVPASTDAGDGTTAHALPAEEIGTGTPPDQLPATRRVIAERAAEELPAGAVVNVGFGAAAHVVDVLASEGRLDEVTFVVEQGLHGGQPVVGDLFGVSRWPAAMLGSPDQFDLFSGGVVDIAFLGMAQLDRHGNVNVSRIGGEIVGPGGFIDISQGVGRVVFCGAFRAGGLRTEVDDGTLRITAEGRLPKLVAAVDEITFSAEQALARGVAVTYVTERAVFELTPDGLTLTEINDGVDLERDVLGQMELVPAIRGPRRRPAGAAPASAQRSEAVPGERQQP